MREGGGQGTGAPPSRWAGPGGSCEAASRRRGCSSRACVSRTLGSGVGPSSLQEAPAAPVGTGLLGPQSGHRDARSLRSALPSLWTPDSKRNHSSPHAQRISVPGGPPSRLDIPDLLINVSVLDRASTRHLPAPSLGAKEALHQVPACLLLKPVEAPLIPTQKPCAYVT